MNNISKFRYCYGCGVCSIVCPTKIIGIKEINGFFRPYIKKQNCIECGLCLKICAFNHDEVSQNNDSDILAYSAWSNTPSIRKECSTGGVGFEIGKYLISKGYKVCGVKYNTAKNIAEHYISFDIDDLKGTIGSKYIPSLTITGFSAINKTDKFLIVGTPCQIDSIRRYIKKYNIERHFILLDFFCHGVPSMKMWRKYLEYIPKPMNSQNVTWRSKVNGWQDSWAISIVDTISNKRKFYSPKSKGDLFFQMFLGHHCFSEACYNKCKYKLSNSAADIRIGDLWGSKFKSNNLGVNGVLTFTDDGENLMHHLNCNDTIALCDENLTTVLEGQMKHCANKPWSYQPVKLLLNTPARLKTIAFIAKSLCFIERKIKR